VARIVVIADDLTGAADCAASAATSGCETAVLLHSLDNQNCLADWPDSDIVSIDANSRCLSELRASELTIRLVHECDAQNADYPGYVLFKKIDSTLRGNVAAEMAALLQARRSVHPASAKLALLMAPALPAQGRTIIGGRVLVHGTPLEETDIWQTECGAAQSNVPLLLGKADLSCGLIDANAVRSGLTCLRQAILDSAEQNDVVVCDSETDDDLCAIANACQGLSSLAAMVGSAGLAGQIPCTLGIAPVTERQGWSFVAGATLFVVGTPASVSRQQAEMLGAVPDISTFRAAPAALVNSSRMNTEIVESLRSRRDVLLMLDGGESCASYDGQLLGQALSGLLPKCAQFLGGLVATGGETARALLDALGIDRLRVLGEVEPGLPFSVADCWKYPLPVITKAGAFGQAEALIRCREFLQGLERQPAALHANNTVVRS
jgi:D-threonate/D-erythronate kinase